MHRLKFSALFANKTRRKFIGGEEKKTALLFIFLCLHLVNFTTTHRVYNLEKDFRAVVHTQQKSLKHFQKLIPQKPRNDDINCGDEMLISRCNSSSTQTMPVDWLWVEGSRTTGTQKFIPSKVLRSSSTFQLRGSVCCRGCSKKVLEWLKCNVEFSNFASVFAQTDDNHNKKT